MQTKARLSSETVPTGLTMAESVRFHRIRLGLTRSMLARELGVHTRTLHRWERGLSAIHPIWLERLAKMEPEGDEITDAEVTT